MRNPAPYSQHASPGFTLMELLVVVVIVLSLAGLGFLGAQRARTTAYMIQSTNRIKGLGYANGFYAGEHNGRYVPVVTSDSNGAAGIQWHFNQEFLAPLMGNVDFIANVEGYEGVDGMPESVLDPIAVKSKKRFWNRISGSYGYNEEGIPGGIPWGSKNINAQLSTAIIKNPSRTFNFMTSTDWLVGLRGKDKWFSTPSNAVEGKTEDAKIAFRYHKKAIAVFYDGHTELISKEDIKHFDDRGGARCAFWGGDR